MNIKLSGSAGSAAADDLPSPMQSVMARWSNEYEVRRRGVAHQTPFNVFWRAIRHGELGSGVFDGRSRLRYTEYPGFQPKRLEMITAALLAGAMFLAGPVRGAAMDEGVVNGGFETAGTNAVAGPLGWDLPDGLGVQWVSDVDSAGHGKTILMDTRVSEREMVAQWKKVGITKWDIPNPASGPIADTYGLSFYSEPFSVVSGAVYRLSFDYKGVGGAKVWVRGYGLVRGELRRVYETWVGCKSKQGAWTSHERVFHPQSKATEIVEFRVMLYAYYPPGLYAFDNVRVERVSTNQAPGAGP